MAVLSSSHAQGRPVCRLTLIDRASGRAHLIGGRALVLYTRDPQRWVVAVAPVTGGAL